VVFVSVNLLECCLATYSPHVSMCTVWYVNVESDSFIPNPFMQKVMV